MVYFSTYIMHENFVPMLEWPPSTVVKPFTINVTAYGRKGIHQPADHRCKIRGAYFAPIEVEDRTGKNDFGDFDVDQPVTQMMWPERVQNPAERVAHAIGVDVLPHALVERPAEHALLTQISRIVNELRIADVDGVAADVFEQK